jgi:hypothetical protein
MGHSWRPGQMVNSICIQVVFANLQQYTTSTVQTDERPIFGSSWSPVSLSAPEDDFGRSSSVPRIECSGASSVGVSPLHVATQAESTLLRGLVISSPFDPWTFVVLVKLSASVNPANQQLRMSRFAELYAASRAAEHILPTAASSSIVPSPMQIKRPLPDERDIGSSASHAEGSSSQKKARAAIATACDRCRKSQSPRLTTIICFNVAIDLTLHCLPKGLRKLGCDERTPCRRCIDTGASCTRTEQQTRTPLTRARMTLLEER